MSIVYANMLTAIIHTGADDVLLAHTLAPLVSGVTEGILKRASVFGETDTNNIRKVSDAAGCYLFGAGNAGLLEAVSFAETNWLLLLNSGAELEFGWTNEVGKFLDQVSRANSQAKSDIAYFTEQTEISTRSISLSLKRLFSSESTANGLICKRTNLKDYLLKAHKNASFPPTIKQLKTDKSAKPHRFKAVLTQTRNSSD